MFSYYYEKYRMFVANIVALAVIIFASFVPNNWKIQHDAFISFLEGVITVILLLNLGGAFKAKPNKEQNVQVSDTTGDAIENQCR